MYRPVPLRLVQFIPKLSADYRDLSFSFTQYFFSVKCKAVPLQFWSGPEGSRKLSFPDFMTTAQDGSKLVSLMHLPPLPPGNTPGTHFC
jgi:hypothetical protein